MSVADQIKALEAQLKALKEAEANKSQAGVGDVVDFVFGRGENKVQHRGRVVGLSEDNKRIRILFGAGFETDVATVLRGVATKVEQTLDNAFDGGLPDAPKPTLDDQKPNTVGAGEFEQQQKEAAAEADANVQAAQAEASKPEVAPLNLDDLPI
ncbi:hypothetical protein JG068_010 [Burkholderia phage JG068]|uniref:Uncharacterized protein n=1 Tax=Burkholderia phage JG068 TaxID=1401297 RepID=U3PB93_9CAUD|nr:hypothetical protein JG068_010 [Burkholderia phage JG068]AGW43592.1 hypothetical protein JG068_010 [Burkholderia phage JG068]